jgi:hypothetical protein
VETSLPSLLIIEKTACPEPAVPDPDPKPESGWKVVFGRSRASSEGNRCGRTFRLCAWGGVAGHNTFGLCGFGGGVGRDKTFGLGGGLGDSLLNLGLSRRGEASRWSVTRRWPESNRLNSWSSKRGGGKIQDVKKYGIHYVLLMGIRPRGNECSMQLQGLTSEP